MDSVNRIFADIYRRCATAAPAPPSTTSPPHAEYDLKLRALATNDLVVGYRPQNAVAQNDLLVGFYLPPDAAPTWVELSCSDREVFECALVPGKVTFALDGRFMLPIICLQFEEVRARCFTGSSSSSSNIMMVVARLRDPDPRRHLAANPWSCTFDNGEMFLFAMGFINRSTSECVARYRDALVLPAADGLAQ